MSRRPKTQLVLSQSEREQLEALTLRRKTAQALALRARIVLGCAAGGENKAVAARQRVSEHASSSTGSMAFWTRRGPGRRARSTTPASMP